jgi:hypothetical protein
MLLSTQETDADSRIGDLVQGDLEPGRYRLVFHPPSSFFSRVELEIALEDTSRHYHVPLLVSPTRVPATAEAERGGAGGALRGAEHASSSSSPSASGRSTRRGRCSTSSRSKSGSPR